MESAAIGSGTRIWAFAHIMKDARIGRDCNIGDHCFIESGARIGKGVTIKNGVAIWQGIEIGNYVMIGPNAVFTNDLMPRSPRFGPVAARYKTKRWLSRTRIGEGATIGANATILCGLTIGKFAMVGAGAVVTRNVPPFALVTGVPARLQGYVDKRGNKVRSRKGES